jgi:sigma-B regulation protein RsbU (phosphoserine phosphatase)
MIPRKGIAFKLALSLLVSCTIIFIVIIAYGYRVSRAILEKEMEDTAALITQSTINFITSKLQPVEDLTRNMAAILEQTDLKETKLKALVKTFVSANPDVFGSIIAFEPYAFDGRTLNFGIYYCDNSPDFILEKHDYFNEEWYSVPRASARPAWSEPYFDKMGGRIMMTTYSVPFRLGSRSKVTGVITSDISLEWLQRTVSALAVEKTGYCFLVSRKGAILAHSAKGLDLSGNILDLAKKSDDAALLEAVGGMAAGSSGLAAVSDPATGRPAWINYAPVPSCRWSLGIVFPKEEVLRDIVKLNRSVIALGAGGTAALLVVILFLAGTITRPLRLLAEKAHVLAGGNLDVDLPSGSSADEVGDFTRTFARMRDSLKRYIQDLAETTAARERMEKELQIAREIQMSMLPSCISPVPGREEIEIYAVLSPAREVGGDFYDFLFLDETHLFFVIGDVSGKGVPAALLMSKIQIVLRIAARLKGDTDSIMDQANREFRACNESCSFVTVLCGILDIESGEVAFTCAGHEPPLLARATGEYEWLDKAKGMVLGIEEDFAYQKKSVTLHPGDTLCLYTDGITEAVNAETQMFGRWKLMEVVSAHRDEPLRDLAGHITGSIEAFSSGVPQADDLTILLLRYKGASS